MEKVLGLYQEAFERFRAVEPILTLEDNKKYCSMVQGMLDTHLSAIPYLARGIANSSAHLDTNTANKFMNETLRSRIGRRVLAEQHIMLSNVFQNNLTPAPSMIGIVNTACRASKLIQKCSALCTKLFELEYQRKAPEVIMDGYLGATFTYIPEHVPYRISNIRLSTFYWNS